MNFRFRQESVQVFLHRFFLCLSKSGKKRSVFINCFLLSRKARASFPLTFFLKIFFHRFILPFAHRT